jgi:hypothetical protein
MEGESQRAQNKKSLLSAGVLLLSLAALQSPLWRTQQSMVRVPVRTGGATLVHADRPIAGVTMDENQRAVAEIVGEREVLIRGRALGEAHLTVALQDGRKIAYRVVVLSESAAR